MLTAAPIPIEDIVDEWITHDTLVTRLKELGDDAKRRRLLEHTCPTGPPEHNVAVQNESHLHCYFSHSATPNVEQAGVNRFTPGGAVRLLARRDIKKGEELTVDYDLSVGYEKFSSETGVASFLQLCDALEVVKRPSELTVLPATVTIDTK